MKKKMDLGRRKFLKATTLGLFGAGVAAKDGWTRAKGGEKIPPQESQEKPKAKIKDHRILGRTGFKVSDLATGYIRDEGIMAAMLDAGINYIDTGESYPGSHQMIGKVIKDRDRKSLFITSKMLMEGETSKEALIKRTQKILQDLDTEYVDCMMLHCPETVEALQHEGFHAAMQELKANGRIHYAGVSNHGSFWFRDPEQTMDRILLAAAEDGRFDIFLFAYNFLRMDQSEKVLEVCNEKKIGTTLMKTTPVFNYYKVKSSVERTEEAGKEVHPLYKEGLVRFKANLDKAEQFIKKHNLQNPDEIRAAAIKFALSNPNVNTVCCSISTYDDLDRILSLSGTKLEAVDNATLIAYKKGCGKLYCRHACGVCEPSCPQGVPVNTIMRYSHYFVAQGREREAMEKYNKIPGAKADVCSTCSGLCETACPYSVPIQGMLLLAHEQLSLA
jgi:predicted aldo/keto reductase-like oxidoreductase